MTRHYAVAVWHEGQRVEYPARTFYEAQRRASLEVARLLRMGFQCNHPALNRWDGTHPVGGGSVHVRIETRTSIHSSIHSQSNS